VSAFAALGNIFYRLKKEIRILMALDRFFKILYHQALSPEEAKLPAFRSHFILVRIIRILFLFAP
jgi:hypothetical protein